MEIFDFDHMMDTFPGVWESVCTTLANRNIEHTHYEFVNCISSDDEYEVTVKHELQDFSLTLTIVRSEDNRTLDIEEIRTW